MNSSGEAKVKLGVNLSSGILMWAPALLVSFSGLLTEHLSALSWYPFPLLFDGNGTLLSQLSQAVCLYPALQGLYVHTG